MNELRIIFMGTPEFAVPSLQILVENKFNVVAVVTAPDKPQGRGKKLGSSPVKVCAVENGIPVLQPINLKAESFLDELRSFNANLQVVVAFRMLPELVWSMPSLGTINLHGSLLPQYRGAAPINWAIINGEKETGVTTFFLKHEIDTGSIIFQEKEPIHDDDNVGSLYERLMHKGANLVLKTVRAIEKNEHTAFPQNETGPINHAPKIFKDTCQINWNQSSRDVYNFVRGLSPYPGAWTIINDKSYKILKVSIGTEGQKTSHKEDFSTDNNSFLKFYTNDGWVNVDILQPEGKKRMDIRDFFRGNKI